MDDDDNLAKWEDNTLTASDRRIILANWFFKACNKALQGEAKRKYFEHAGALLTADGTDDNLIKLECTVSLLLAARAKRRAEERRQAVAEQGSVHQDESAPEAPSQTLPIHIWEGACQ